MFAFRSLLLTFMSLLVLMRIDVAIASLYQCGLPDHFTVGTANRSKTDFYQSQLTVNVPDYGFWIYTYPGSNTITFGTSNIAINFNGIVVYNTPGNKRMPQKRISQAFQDRISGVAQRIQMNYTDSDISDCHIYLLPITVDRLVVSSRIAGEIRNLAESCIQSAICLKIGKLGMRYTVAPANQNGLSQLPGLTGPMAYIKTFYGPMPLQNGFNTLMDLGLAKLVADLRATRQNTISVPTIDSHFKVSGTFFDTKGHFEASDGTFSDMTILTRKLPVTVSHEGKKFMMSSTFSINTAKLSYSYKLKNGLKTAKGKLTSSIKEVNLEARFIADYTNMPCMTTLEYLKVTDFGKMSSHFTNVGSLKSLIKKRTWFDKNALTSIGEAIEQRLRQAVESELWIFNCERFRP